MRRVATGKKITFSESLFQYKEFLFLVEHMFEDDRTQNLRWFQNTSKIINSKFTRQELSIDI